MAKAYKAQEIITNNIVRATDKSGGEVLLIGKGIGYNRHKNDLISEKAAHNIFALKDEQEQALYKQLIRTTSPSLIELVNNVIDFIQDNVNESINEHIHIALTDHISHMVRRCKLGVPLSNPFELEIENLYPKEYGIAKEVVEKLAEELAISIPKGEISFITPHIVSALSSESLAEVSRHTQLILKLVKIIEDNLMCTLDRKSLNYVRLVTHIRFAIERVERNEKLDVPEEFACILEKQYKELYALAYKLVKIMQTELRKEIEPSEIVYLTIHLYQFAEKI